MTKSLQRIFVIILFAMISVPICAGQAGTLTPEAAAAKKRALQKPLKMGGMSVPDIKISSPPDQGASTTQTSADFTITTHKPAKICWQLDYGMSTCSAQGVMSFQANLANLAQGSHTLAVTAYDASSNIMTSVRHWRVIIE